MRWSVLAIAFMTTMAHGQYLGVNYQGNQADLALMMARTNSQMAMVPPPALLPPMITPMPSYGYGYPSFGGGGMQTQQQWYPSYPYYNPYASFANPYQSYSGFQGGMGGGSGGGGGGILGSLLNYAPKALSFFAGLSGGSSAGFNDSNYREPCYSCNSYRSSSSLDYIRVGSGSSYRSTSDYDTEASHSSSERMGRSSGEVRIAHLDEEKKKKDEPKAKEEDADQEDEESSGDSEEDKKPKEGKAFALDLGLTLYTGERVQLTFKAKSKNERDAQRDPIWPSFIKAFKACAPGCEPAGYMGEGERGGPTCHTGGNAIDLMGMICNGEMISAKSRSKFIRFATCMKGDKARGIKGKMRGLYWQPLRYYSKKKKKWLTRTKTEAHQDHIHLSNGCRQRMI